MSFTIKDSGVRQEFASGMVRDTAEGKTDYSLLLNGPMLPRWATHLTKGEVKYPPDPVTGQANWTKAEGPAELRRFKKSAFRHFMQWINGDVDEDHAAAVFFNINGAEYVKAKLDPVAQAYEQKFVEISGVKPEDLIYDSDEPAPTPLERYKELRANHQATMTIPELSDEAHTAVDINGVPVHTFLGNDRISEYYGGTVPFESESTHYGDVRGTYAEVDRDKCGTLDGTTPLPTEERWNLRDSGPTHWLLKNGTLFYVNPTTREEKPSNMKTFATLRSEYGNSLRRCDAKGVLLESV